MVTSCHIRQKLSFELYCFYGVDSKFFNLNFTAIHNWHGNVPHGLVVDVGDSVEIVEECAQWYRGTSSRKPRLVGIFPKSFIYIKDLSKTDSVVAECTQVLREWSEIWKRLYVVSKHLPMNLLLLFWVVTAIGPISGLFFRTSFLKVFEWTFFGRSDLKIAQCVKSAHLQSKNNCKFHLILRVFENMVRFQPLMLRNLTPAAVEVTISYYYKNMLEYEMLEKLSSQTFSLFIFRIGIRSNSPTYGK